jgi:hypothetical protein
VFWNRAVVALIGLFAEGAARLFYPGRRPVRLRRKPASIPAAAPEATRPAGAGGAAAFIYQGAMMPGPVSDSYDPEFGTGANAAAVGQAVRAVGQLLTDITGIGASLRDIVTVATGPPGPSFTALLSEREWRLLRFAVNRALESL